jgi:hypothetical protein
MRIRSKLPGVARVAMSASLALGAAGALGAAFALGTAAPAGAATVSMTYTCPIVVSGSTLTSPSFPISFTATAPSSVTPGGSVTLTDMQATATIPASLVTLLVSALGVTSFGGTVKSVDFNATGATPATINGAPSAGFTFSVAVKSGQTASITVPTSPETVGPWTAGSSGTVVITPGDLDITSNVKGTAATIDCTPPSSIPSSDTFDVAISSSSSSTPSTTVPATHTGEPWAGWPYWAIIGVLGLAGVGSLERATRIRRRRA